MLRLSEILNVMEFEKGLDSVPVHRTEPTQEDRDRVASIFGWESFPDPVTGETLYRRKDNK
jgi:hypothetical protein